MPENMNKNVNEEINDNCIKNADCDDECILEIDDSTLVKAVTPGGIAEQVGIEPGDIVALINNEKIIDVFDYRMLCDCESISVTVVKKNQEVWQIDIEKDETDDLGIEFEYSLLSEEKDCQNKCIFCFIDQLPKGMRETMYFKDDDPRLSFLTGNYVSLTNTSDEELKRIIKFRLSPINVSVHTTNPELRCKMLNNRFAGNVLERIKMITQAGLTVNAQVVLCKGYNDGQELERTINDLSALYPGVNSVSVVPVGLTKYREGLTPLQPFNSEDSRIVIETLTAMQNRFLENSSIKSRFVYLADEFYVNADIPLPEVEVYEDFPQIENGVGMVSLLINEVRTVCSEMLKTDSTAAAFLLEENRRVTIVCGEAMYKQMSIIKEIIEDTFHNLEIVIIEAKNHFFGGHVTVTGLLTGSDVLRALEERKDRYLGQAILLSDAMLRDGEDVFLDDMTLGELQEQIGVKIEKVNHLSGLELVNKATALEIELEYDEDE